MSTKSAVNSVTGAIADEVLRTAGERLGKRASREHDRDLPAAARPVRQLDPASPTLDRRFRDRQAEAASACTLARIRPKAVESMRQRFVAEAGAVVPNHDPDDPVLGPYADGDHAAVATELQRVVQQGDDDALELVGVAETDRIVGDRALDDVFRGGEPLHPFDRSLHEA